MEQRTLLRGKSYAGNNPFGKSRLCAMNGLVRYLRYIPCVEIVDVHRRSHFSVGSYGGMRNPPVGQEAHPRTRSPHVGQGAGPPGRLQYYITCMTIAFICRPQPIHTHYLTAN